MTGDREDQGQTDNRVLWTEAHVQGQRPYRERDRIKVGKTCKQIKGWCIHSNKTTRLAIKVTQVNNHRHRINDIN